MILGQLVHQRNNIKVQSRLWSIKLSFIRVMVPILFFGIVAKLSKLDSRNQSNQSESKYPI
jgi:hypothetical protein